MQRMKQQPGAKRVSASWIMAMLMLMALIIPAPPVGAEETGQVRMAVQPGLSGLYKVGLPAGLQITISNQGDAFNGLLVVAPEESQERMEAPPQNTRYQKNIKVAAKGVTKTTLMLPSDTVNQGAKVVLLVDGKPLAASPIQGTAVNGGLIALSLGEKPLKGGVAPWLDQTYGGQTAIKYFVPANLPEDPLELVMADIIIVDDVAVDQLKKRQFEVLKDWVSLGGILLLSGGAGSTQDGPLADISPVQANKQINVSADLAGLRVTQGEVSVRTGQLVNGEVIAKDQDVIVIAARDYGKGRVVYSGIALEELNSESARIWPLLFGQTDGTNAVDMKMMMAQEQRQIGNDRLSNAASYIPQLKTPPVPQVVIAWIIYVVVVGPGLYLLLKRYDRRDWMWWLIPTCAVITTGVVYLMSPVQRINAPISQTLAVVEIMDRNKAEINATASFVTPYGGTLNVEGTREAFIWSNYMHSGTKTPIIQYQESAKPRMSFPDVEYWSMRQARATVLKKEFGKIDGSLVFQDGFIRGEIVNNTPMNLRNCMILLGGRIISLENLPPGGQLQVNQSLDKWPNSLGPKELRDVLVPPVGLGEPDQYVRERQMVDSLLGPMMNVRTNLPVFYGWSEESLDMFKILSNPEKSQAYHLSLVTQELPLSIPVGQKVELPPGVYIPRVIESRGAFNQTPMGYTLYEGKLTLGIDLLRPLKKETHKVVSINFLEQVNQNIVVKIYDWQDKKWQDIPSTGVRLGSDELKRYESQAGQFRFQIEKIAGIGQPEHIDLPAIVVEGVVSQ